MAIDGAPSALNGAPSARHPHSESLLKPRVMRVMKMLAYRYARAVHDIGVESGGDDDDDGGDDGWIDRSSERTFTLACMLMAPKHVCAYRFRGYL